LAFFGKTLLYNDLQEQITSATFLADDDDNKIIEDFEIKEEIKYNSGIIEHFDVENIICLNN
ncbi:12310_t:CDS:1, partial [Cetraspora pellucida]